MSEQSTEAPTSEAGFKALSILVFRGGGGLAFIQEADGTVSILKVEGTEKPTDKLTVMGTCLKEHAAYVGYELSKAAPIPDALR